MRTEQGLRDERDAVAKGKKRREPCWADVDFLLRELDAVRRERDTLGKLAEGMASAG